MAAAKTENMSASMRGFGSLPILRQLGLMVGLAASVALGVSVVLWSQTPNYRVLYSGLASQDAAQIADALQKDGIEYKVDEATGAVMVGADQVHAARLKLASQGLPKGTAQGFEMLNEQPTFGSSQFMESARYQHALEGELGRTIATLGNVQNARVHLALPKQSVFVRNREQPSASILVSLFPGRELSEGQVSSVVHLVASSVPNMSAERVTVIDQKGRLLTIPESSRGMQLTTNQFEYRRRLEDYYIKRIEDIISPMAGAGGVRAQVVAELDFSITEETKETFNPEQNALRSEQTVDEQSGLSGNVPSGVPGALTNQPPAGGTVTPPSSAAIKNPAALNAPAAANNGSAALNSTKRATRNYEVDRTISHTQMPTGSLRRLSVAVVIDDKQTVGQKGEAVRTPLKPEEITRLTALVKETVGFNEARGDSLNVINASFTVPAETPVPDQPLIERPWVKDLAKQGLGAIAVLLLIFVVLKPVLRSLAEKGKSVPATPLQQIPGNPELTNMGSNQVGSPSQGTAFQAGGQSNNNVNYESQLANARALVGQDPKRVAQVVKGWVATDA
jgi:flagellar M-ring protein FliF